MGLFERFPYTNFHDLNLTWILEMLKKFENELENFITLNTIKYANPIQWNITKQYKANTVVIDANDGTAYLSVNPVPTGVAITNTDYWIPIFTLNLLSANQNITLRDDGNGTLSTFESVAGDWLIWGGVLYKVTQTINVNEAYVIGYNITRYTVELFIKDYIDTLQLNIDNLATIVGDLNDLTTSDKTSIVNAINSLLSNFETIVGDLNNLTTIDKTSIVNAINELVTTINNIYSSYVVVTAEMFGAVGDGITDDTLAIQSALNSAKIVYLNNSKTYLVSSVTVPKGHSIIGVGTIKLLNDSMIDGIILKGNNEIKDITITDGYVSFSASHACIFGDEVSNCIISNVKFNNIHLGYCVEFVKSEFLDITYNNIDHYSYAGVMLLNGCLYCDVSHNKVYDGQMDYINRYAICISGYDTVNDRTASHISCNYNYCEDISPRWEGIDSHGCKDCEFIGNTLIGFNNGITLTIPTTPASRADNLQNIVIKNNHIESALYNNISSGITISSGNNPTYTHCNIEVENNNIECVGGGYTTSVNAAISLRGTALYKNVKITNNVINTTVLGISIASVDNAIIEGNDISGGATVDAYAIHLIDANVTCHNVNIRDNNIHDVVRSVRGSLIADLVIYENNIDNGVYRDDDYMTTPKSSLIANTKSVGKSGAFIVSTSGNEAGWLCVAANNWLTIAGTLA